MFRARLPSIFITSHKRHACQGICTLSPLHAAMRFAKTRNATSKVLPLPREMTLEVSKVLRPKTAAHLLKMARKICAWHTSRVSTRHDARGNVTKRHDCHANEGTRCLEARKVTTGHRHACHAMFCKARYRHGHTAIARTRVDGCERLRTVAQRLANTASTPKPAGWNGNPCYAFGKNVNKCIHTIPNFITYQRK